MAESAAHREEEEEEVKKISATSTFTFASSANVSGGKKKALRRSDITFWGIFQMLSLRKELSQIKHYATTTDLWSSRTMEPHISLTVHSINDEWELCSKCLQTSYFPDDPDSPALESWIES